MTGASQEAELDERALVARMLAGDEWAMEAFGDRYFPGLYRFARARLAGKQDLARDIVQTTVVKALTKLRTFRGEAPLAAWLRACCRNEIAMHFRKVTRFPTFSEDDDRGPDFAALANPDHIDGADQAVSRKETSQAVHDALDLLPSHYAQALEWKYIERLAVKEIAVRLELSPKATESVLTRARGAFRSTFKQLAQEQRSSGREPVLRGEVAL